MHARKFVRFISHSLLKLFVDVVDAELLEVVAVEDLETVNV